MSRKLTHRPASRGAPHSRLTASTQRPVGIWGVIGGKKNPQAAARTPTVLRRDAGW